MQKTLILLGGLSLLAGAALNIHGQQPAAAATSPVLAAPTWWHPTNTGPNNGPEFQWELGSALNLNNAKEMGTGALNAAGKVAPNPTVFDIDGIDNPASTVTALHNLGDKAICYIEVGSAGNYYSASDEGIATTYYAQLKAAGDMGKKMAGYPEYYVNINAASTVSIIESMISKQCGPRGSTRSSPILTTPTTIRPTSRSPRRRTRRTTIRSVPTRTASGWPGGRRTVTTTPRSPRRWSPPRTSCWTRSATTTPPARS